MSLKHLHDSTDIGDRYPLSREHRCEARGLLLLCLGAIVIVIVELTRLVAAALGLALQFLVVGSVTVAGSATASSSATAVGLATVAGSRSTSVVKERRLNDTRSSSWTQWTCSSTTEQFQQTVRSLQGALQEAMPELQDLVQQQCLPARRLEERAQGATQKKKNI